MSTVSSPDVAGSMPVDVEITAPGLPPGHPAEADTFCRQMAMPGHNQEALERARILIVGCGGLGSWIALALGRMGSTRLTLVDPDSFDRTNAPRQLVVAKELGAFKAHALARALVPHMTHTSALKGIARPFAPDLFETLGEVDIVTVGVDNNRARLAAVAFGVSRRIPVVFAMLSRDGLRAQVFLQKVGGPCLACVLPNLDEHQAAPCAAASIASCYLAGAHAVEMTVAALSGALLIPSWRETSLDGSTERASNPGRRDNCLSCSHP